MGVLPVGRLADGWTAAEAARELSGIQASLAAEYPDIADVTVEQLAGMKSPIQDYANTGVTIAQVVEDPQHVFTPDELIAAGGRYHELYTYQARI